MTKLVDGHCSVCPRPATSIVRESILAGRDGKKATYKPGEARKYCDVHKPKRRYENYERVN